MHKIIEFLDRSFKNGENSLPSSLPATGRRIPDSTSMPNICPKCRFQLQNDCKTCPQCSEASDRFEASLQNVLGLIEQNQIEAALGELNQSIEFAPSERLPACYALRGFAHLKKLDFRRSEDDLTESLALDWEQSQTYAWRAAARGEQNKWRLAFDDLDRAYEFGGRLQDRYLTLMEAMFSKSTEYFQNKIIEASPDAELVFERGWVYLRMNQFMKAYLDLSLALKLQPQHPWASVGLAELFVKRHEFKGLNRALELCDDAMLGGLACRRHSLKIRAIFYSELGDLIRAKACISELAHIAGDNLSERINCVQLYVQVGDHLSAVDLLNAALEQNPDLHLAVLRRGDCFAAICNYSLAAQDYSQYLESFPESAAGLVRRGKMSLAMRRFSNALKDLDRAIKIEPTDFEANLCLGQTHLEMEDFSQAQNYCMLAVKLDGRQAKGFAALAAVYHRLGSFSQAIEEYGRSIELAKNLTERSQYRFLRGISAYQFDNIENALADFSQATEERPNHAGAWIWLAATLARQEDWGKAILALQQAIQTRPSATQQYQQLGRPVAERAIQFYTRLEQRQGESPKAKLFFFRGLAHQFLENHVEAIRDFTRALKLNPADHDLVIRRGQTLTQLGDRTEAISDFSKALARSPDDHRALYLRAIARIANREAQLAKEDLSQAIRLSSNQPRYFQLMGEIEAKSNNLNEAITAFDQAVLLDPTNPVAYRSRGFAHLAKGRNWEAIRDFSHSLELQPTQFELLVERGEAYLRSNQPLSALEDFETALTHQNQLARAYSGRAAVLVIQQRHEYALIWLTKAIHRFSDPHDLAEIIFARGKVFFQMNRFAPAINDFTLVIDLMRDAPAIVAAARYARGSAQIHHGQLEMAKRDFVKLMHRDGQNPHFKATLDWLKQPSQALPPILLPSTTLRRPTRPPEVRTGVSLTASSVSKWKSEPPFQLWIVKAENNKEYGPVPLTVIADWASEGRIVNGMKMLRADWSKWKRVERIFPEITPLESLPGLIEEFPAIDTRNNAKDTAPQSGPERH